MEYISRIEFGITDIINKLDVLSNYMEYWIVSEIDRVILKEKLKNELTQSDLNMILKKEIIDNTKHTFSSEFEMTGSVEINGDFINLKFEQVIKIPAQLPFEHVLSILKKNYILKHELLKARLNLYPFVFKLNKIVGRIL